MIANLSHFFGLISSCIFRWISLNCIGCETALLRVPSNKGSFWRGLLSHPMQLNPIPRLIWIRSCRTQSILEARLATQKFLKSGTTNKSFVRSLKLLGTKHDQRFERTNTNETRIRAASTDSHKERQREICPNLLFCTEILQKKTSNSNKTSILHRTTVLSNSTSSQKQRDQKFTENHFLPWGKKSNSSLMTKNKMLKENFLNPKKIKAIFSPPCIIFCQNPPDCKAPKMDKNWWNQMILSTA